MSNHVKGGIHLVKCPQDVGVTGYRRRRPVRGGRGGRCLLHEVVEQKPATRQREWVDRWVREIQR